MKREHWNTIERIIPQRAKEKAWKKRQLFSTKWSTASSCSRLKLTANQANSWSIQQSNWNLNFTTSDLYYCIHTPGGITITLLNCLVLTPPVVLHWTRTYCLMRKKGSWYFTQKLPRANFSLLFVCCLLSYACHPTNEILRNILSSFLINFGYYLFSH